MSKRIILLRSILAGICIGFGGAIFIKLGGIIGAIMFAFGLLSVVHFKLPLYTGTAGFIKLSKSSEYAKMGLIFIGNFIGCLLLALLMHGSLDAINIIQSRLDAGHVNCLLNAIGCGIIMTLIVQGARDKNLLLIIFGIPLFILLGFYHSIADAFYLFCASDSLRNAFIFNGYYPLIILGNFIGCNIPRLLEYDY